MKEIEFEPTNYSSDLADEQRGQTKEYFPQVRPNVRDHAHRNADGKSASTTPPTRGTAA